MTAISRKMHLTFRSWKNQSENFLGLLKKKGPGNNPEPFTRER
jgi:hypothetical protein